MVKNFFPIFNLNLLSFSHCAAKCNEQSKRVRRRQEQEVSKVELPEATMGEEGLMSPLTAGRVAGQSCCHKKAGGLRRVSVCRAQTLPCHIYIRKALFRDNIV